ncbi:MAG: type II toxin-antitoxin system death-on-curing family toxin [Flavobacteriales bacterium]
MIHVNEVLWIHQSLIKTFGGIEGVRDWGMLESAIHRPFATFDGNELYPNPINKAAALFESLLMNHPFVDGNKRTAYTSMRVLLIRYGYDLHASSQVKYDFVMEASNGNIRYESVTKWVDNHAVPYP